MPKVQYEMQTPAGALRMYVKEVNAIKPLHGNGYDIEGPWRQVKESVEEGTLLLQGWVERESNRTQWAAWRVARGVEWNLHKLVDSLEFCSVERKVEAEREFPALQVVRGCRMFLVQWVLLRALRERGDQRRPVSQYEQQLLRPGMREYVEQRRIGEELMRNSSVFTLPPTGGPVPFTRETLQQGVDATRRAIDEATRRREEEVWQSMVALPPQAPPPGGQTPPEPREITLTRARLERLMQFTEGRSPGAPVSVNEVQVQKKPSPLDTPGKRRVMKLEE